MKPTKRINRKGLYYYFDEERPACCSVHAWHLYKSVIRGKIKSGEIDPEKEAKLPQPEIVEVIPELLMSSSDFSDSSSDLDYVPLKNPLHVEKPETKQKPRVKKEVKGNFTYNYVNPIPPDSRSKYPQFSKKVGKKLKFKK